MFGSWLRLWARLPIFVSILVAVGGRVRSAGAETGTSTPAWAIDDVRVEAEPLPTHPDPTASVRALDARRIRRADARIDGVAGLVDTVAGARVLDLGGPVHGKQLTVRGGSPSQVSLRVDGTDLSSPFATGLDLGWVAPEAIEAIEVARGGGGAALGDGALTGGVSIRTRRPTEQPWSTASLAYGSFDTTRVAGAFSARPISLVASFERTDGDFGFVSRLQGLPDVRRLRQNNDAHRGLLSGRIEHAFFGGTGSIVAGGGFREAGVAGFETRSDLDARELRGTGRLRAGWRRAASADRLGIDVGLSSSLLSIDYQRSIHVRGIRR